VEIAENRGGSDGCLGSRWVAICGTEPLMFAWEAEVLPLNNTR
jgi:hypothetical protein